MRARRGALLGWAVAIAVSAVVAVAGVDALTSSSGDSAPARARQGEEPLHGPDVPLPGALPGRLLVADAASCRLRVLELATMTLGGPGPVTSCRIWPSPTGDRAVVTRGSVVDGKPVQELWLVALGGPPRYERRLGPARASPAWSRDGGLVAWCGADGASIALDVDTGRERSYPGCFPQVVDGGAVATRERAGRSTTIRLDGTPALAPPELASAFGGRARKGAFARIFGSGTSASGDLVLGLSRGGGPFGGEAAIATWHGRELVDAVRLPMPYAPAATFFGLRIEPSPAGTEAALVFPESFARGQDDDLAGIVDLRSGRIDTHLAEARYDGFAWAPDGGWLALSTGDEIRIYSGAAADPVYVLPVRARAVAWLAF